jgi:hypothetical protein
MINVHRTVVRKQKHKASTSRKALGQLHYNDRILQKEGVRM